MSNKTSIRLSSYILSLFKIFKHHFYSLTKKISLLIKKNYKRLKESGAIVFAGRIFTYKLFIFIFLMIDAYLFFLITQTSFNIYRNRINYSQNNSKAAQYPYYIKNGVPYISAQAAVVFDKDSRVAVYKKNEGLRFSPASSAKIMTAIVALENYNFEEVLTVEDLNDVRGSKINLVAGERITVENLLYGLLLSSGNDAAYVLANNFKGGALAFVGEMNRKANQLMLYNTFFTDPSGYDDGNFTTAYDLARLASNALENKMFSEIVVTETKIIYDENKAIAHRLKNINELLGQNGVNGVKTGFTNEAGGVLVTSLNHKGKTLVITVLKSNDRFADTKEIIAKVVNNIEFVDY